MRNSKFNISQQHCAWHVAHVGIMLVLPNSMVVEIILLKSSTNNTIRNFKTVMFLSPFGYLYDRHRMFFSYTFI